MISYFAINSWAFVAPLVGAWIEISLEKTVATQKKVAPLVGAWIEILRLNINSLF